MPQPTTAPAPAKRRPLYLTAGDRNFKFTTASIGDFPEAQAFLNHLVATGRLQSHNIATYVKLAARLKRQGRLAALDLLTHRVERTAANAYVKWRLETYDARMAQVTEALARHLRNRRALRHVRVHGLVPPMDGAKRIPRVMPAEPIDMEALRSSVGQPMTDRPAPHANILWVATNAWTLHVPEKPAAAHVDPCESCFAIELTEAEVSIIAGAFEQAWGHRELPKVPPEAYLFGEPPPDNGIDNVKAKHEKIAALAGAGVTADELVRMNASVARDTDSFVARLAEGAEGVYVSRAACGGRLADVLGAIWQTWGTP